MARFQPRVSEDRMLEDHGKLRRFQRCGHRPGHPPHQMGGGVIVRRIDPLMTEPDSERGSDLDILVIGGRNPLQQRGQFIGYTVLRHSLSRVEAQPLHQRGKDVARCRKQGGEMAARLS